MNVLNKIWRSRINIPRRIVLRVVRCFILKLGLFKVSVSNQESEMNNIGLNRTYGLEKLNYALKEVFNKQYDERDGMFSEHLIILASLSVGDVVIRKILEIGTYDGQTARILSTLFPAAHIVTIDLPSTEEEFHNSYNRSGAVKVFIENRNNNLANTSNVEFRQMNSLELINTDETFDLIWVDGAHGYPIVAMDILNSYRLLNNNGYVLIDDIRKKVSNSDKMYDSIGGYESLKALFDAKLITAFNLFSKRLGGIFNTPSEKKYIGLFRKNL